MTSRTRASIAAVAVAVAVAVVVAACSAPTPQRQDGAMDTNSGDGPLGDSASDAECPGSVALAPITFHAYDGDYTCLTLAAPSLPLSLRIWLFKDGAAVLDTTVKCDEPILLENLPPGDYELASGLPPVLVYGTGLSLVGEEYRPGCSMGDTSPVCAPVQLTVPPCTTASTALDLFCTNAIADGCHGF